VYVDDGSLPMLDYGGTRHSTLTALGEFLSPEEVKRGSLHKTNKALERYLQGRARYAKKVSQLRLSRCSRARRVK